MSIGNNGSRLIGNTEFYGGLSTDKKIGIENSYADAECLDVRKSPSQMTVLPKAKNVASGQSFPILAMCQAKSGDIYAIDTESKLFKVKTDNSGLDSVNATTPFNSGYGLAYYSSDDALYFTSSDYRFGSYGNILNVPAGGSVIRTTFDKMDDNGRYITYPIEVQEYGETIYYQSDPTTPRSDGTQTCAVPTSVSETDANKALVLPKATNIAAIGVFFTTAVASNVYLELHDENDNVVLKSATKAISAGSDTLIKFDMLPNPANALSADNFPRVKNPWSGSTSQAGSVYHLHIVSSISGNYVRTNTADDMYLGLYFTVETYVLEYPHNGKHVLATFDDVYFGNGQYVAKKSAAPLDYLNDSIFIQNALRVDDDFEVCSFCMTDDYLIVGAEKYNLNGSRPQQGGRLYFWDRVSEAPSFMIDCPMGSPSSMFNMGDITYIIVNGALYAYTGGKELVKVRTFRGTDTELSGASTSIEVSPNMMAMRREVLMMAYPTFTTAQSIKYGVRAWGATDKNFPNCFTYNYRIPGATDVYNNEDENYAIACLYNFGDSLFFAYGIENVEDSTWAYGLACVDNTCGTETKFYWESLVYDAGSPAYDKQGLRVGIYFDPLPEDCSITPKYKIDNGDWVLGTVSAGEGDRYVHCEINKRFHELQIGFEGTSANDYNTPVIKQVGAEIRILTEEQKL